MDPGPWTSPMDPVHGPPHSMDHPYGPGSWTTPLGLSFVIHAGNVGNMREREGDGASYVIWQLQPTPTKVMKTKYTLCSPIKITSYPLNFFYQYTFKLITNVFVG